MWGQTIEKPLLFLDQNYNSLVKEVKASKELDLKTYSYGSCKVTQVGTDVTIYLCPEKGKLTQPALLKPLKKIFKGFKPKLFFEVVAELESIAVEANDTAVLEEGSSSALPRAKAIGQNLLKYHQLFQASDKKVKAADKSDPKRNKLLIQRTKVLQHLKHLCAAWTEEIQPQQDQLPLKANWGKLYTHWSAFFAKRQAAKEGKSEAIDARKAEEERLYVKAVEDLERFFDDLEKGKTVDPSIIENDIQTLETHLVEWQQFAKGKSAFSAELEAIEEQVVEILEDWKEEKPKMEAYFEAVQRLEQAVKNEASEEEIKKLDQEAELLAHA